MILMLARWLARFHWWRTRHHVEEWRHYCHGNKYVVLVCMNCGKVFYDDEV
jgi:hypothetical protein